MDKIIKMLTDTSIEKRIAAAIVLSELKVKSPKAIAGYLGLLETGVPVLQRHALEALIATGNAKKGADKAFHLLGSSAEDVRRAATATLRAVGADIVPKIRARMPTATPEERRVMDGILADLGGKDAFATLLHGLATSEGEAAKAAALAVRQHVKDSGARERRSYASETEKYLKAQKKKGESSVTAIAAAIKILGYLEDATAVPTLLTYATRKDAAPLVRQEALIALRFAIGDKRAGAKVMNALIEAAEATDRALAHTALHTLGSMEVPSSMTGRFEKLLGHEDVDRVRFAASYLAGQKGEAAAKALVKVLSTQDRKRAEVVAEVLAGREDAAPALARALLGTKDADRAWLMRKVLGPIAKKISPAIRKELLSTATKRLAKGERNWEALVEVVRDADSKVVAEALRALAHKIRNKNGDKAQTALTIVCKTDKATDDDRYALAALELKRGTRDTRPAARSGDPSLQKLASLLARGFDVSKALRKDRALDLDHLYYVGFHFTESGHPLGEELLSFVVKKGGRSKVAKMAKNKLALAES